MSENMLAVQLPLLKKEGALSRLTICRLSLFDVSPMPSRSSQPFDRYTQRARQSKRRDFLPNSDSSPAAQHLHNWTRRLLYGILRIIFHNQPILNKLPQSEVKSILIN